MAIKYESLNHVVTECPTCIKYTKHTKENIDNGSNGTLKAITCTLCGIQRLDTRPDTK